MLPPNAAPGPGPVIPPGMPPMGAQPPSRIGPVTAPSSNGGNQVSAHAAIKNAAELLRHVERYEAKAASYIAPQRRRKAA